MKRTALFLILFFSLFFVSLETNAATECESTYGGTCTDSETSCTNSNNHVLSSYGGFINVTAGCSGSTPVCCTPKCESSGGKCIEKEYCGEPSQPYIYDCDGDDGEVCCQQNKCDATSSTENHVCRKTDDDNLGAEGGTYDEACRAWYGTLTAGLGAYKCYKTKTTTTAPTTGNSASGTSCGSGQGTCAESSTQSCIYGDISSGAGDCNSGLCCKNSSSETTSTASSTASASSTTTCEKSPEEGLSGGLKIFKGSIVPCGRSCDDPNTSDVNEGKSCTLCHFVILVKRLYELLLSLLVIVAFLFLTIAGVLYIVSGTSPGLKTTAKSIVTKTLTGFALFLLSWLIVFTILKALSFNTSGNWYELKCDTDSVFDTGSTTTSGTTATGTTAASTEEASNGDTLTHDEAVSKLSAAGISVSSSGNCSDQNNSSCTSLEGIPSSTIDDIIALKNGCSGASVVVSGGTETGHQSHGSGKSVVDFSWDDTLAKCVSGQSETYDVSKVCTTSSDSAYRVDCTYNESSRHLHVVFS